MCGSEGGAIRVRISDLLESAPAPVTEALAHILLGKLYRKPAARQYVHRYRLYLNSKDVRREIGVVRRTRGRKAHTGPAGSVHHLEKVFEELNLKHFGGMMARPALGWSHIRSRTRLGHFDPSHNMIVISRIFDDTRAPAGAGLEYVMYPRDASPALSGRSQRRAALCSHARIQGARKAFPAVQRSEGNVAQTAEIALLECLIEQRRQPVAGFRQLLADHRQRTVDVFVTDRNVQCADGCASRRAGRLVGSSQRG